MRFTRRRLLQQVAASAYLLPNAAGQGQPVGRDHDLNLAEWGPYSKNYHGVSHVADPVRGLRFDLIPAPAFHRRTPMVPNVLWESGCHLWEAVGDLSYYSIRYELEWKDRVWCDGSFYAAPGNGRYIRCKFVNDTSDTQHVLLHWLSALRTPGASHSVRLPEGAKWIHGLDYQELIYARPPADDHLMPDALVRGEIRGARFVNGSGLGRNSFGVTAGDQVMYRLPDVTAGCELALRYQARGPVTVRLEGVSTGRFPLAPSNEPQSLVAPLSGGGMLRIVSEGGAALEIHGLALARPGSAGWVSFEPARYNVVPELHRSGENQLLLRYAPTQQTYGLAWTPAPHRLREIIARELDGVFQYNTNDHVAGVLRGEGEGHFTDVMCAPVTLAAGERRVLHALVCCGAVDTVRGELARFGAGSAEQAHASSRSRRWTPAGTGRFRFSQERLAATVLTNVVYPIYARRSYVRHNTPGRFWDSLYTWDSGFTAIGLAQLDTWRALECLRAYTSTPGDPNYAYVQHGTPLPVQIYAFQELWPRIPDRGLIEEFYPRLRQMYMFLAGRSGGSTTRRLPSGLLQTWDYFYNTGWDDYPAQMSMHDQKLAPRTATAIVTSHLIRCAKSLSLMEAALGRDHDSGIYREDISAFSDALQKYSWDAGAGYFSYVLHDDKGAAAGILRHASGQNFNMGMDGAAPLIAGICDRRQQRLLLERLTDPQRLWTPSGLTAVDQSAAYYRPDGYWNGSVWMPHQWFIWKSLLDHGLAKEARRIAMTALEVFEAEVARTYHCHEHFIAATGRGAGWHQFGALSCPLLAWHSAYFRPGSVTTGFDGWIRKLEWTKGRLSTDIAFLAGPAEVRTVLVVPEDGGVLSTATWNGREMAITAAGPGGMEIMIPGDSTGGVLVVQ